MSEIEKMPKKEGADYLSEILKAITAQPPSKSEQTHSPVGDEKLSELLSLLIKGNETAEKPPEEASSTAVGGLLSSLTSDPEIIKKLPDIIASVKPLIDMLSHSQQSPTQAFTSHAMPALTSQRGEASERAALLCAMKPYLSTERREAIDYIVKLGRLGDLLKTL